MTQSDYERMSGIYHREGDHRTAQSTGSNVMVAAYEQHPRHGNGNSKSRSDLCMRYRDAGSYPASLALCGAFLAPDFSVLFSSFHVRTGCFAKLTLHGLHPLQCCY